MASNPSPDPLSGIKKKNRDRLHIGMDILKFLSEAKVPYSRTRILFKANVSWSIILNVLARLLKAGWTTEEHEGIRVRCTITPDGRAALTSYTILRVKFDQEVSGLSEKIP